MGRGRRWRAFGVIAVLALLLAGCGRSAPWAGRPYPGQEYQLHILATEWNYSPQSPEAVQAVLANESLDHDVLTIEPRDITEYDWSGRRTFDGRTGLDELPHHSLTLTPLASARVTGLCGEDWRHLICDRRLDLHYFVVTLGGRRLFGGAFWTGSLQPARPFPVIGLNRSGDLVVLQFFPTNWEGSARFDLPEIRDYFRSLGKLRE